MKFIIVGCGLTGAVVARKLAEYGHDITIYEKRNHIGGNVYDYKDQYGFLVQKYGPHIFHTSDESVYRFINQFAKWNNFKLVCGAEWDGKYTSTPFNFSTIDTFYDADMAETIKEAIKEAFPNEKTATVVELLKHPNPIIKAFAEFLYENDYAPYTAKQWGIQPSEIDPSVLKRVPVILSYDTGYFSDKYELMPVESYTEFVGQILNHPCIKIVLETDALEQIKIDNNIIYWNESIFDGMLIYTGPLDELFGCCYGELPYRSLKFVWKHENVDSLQEAPVVAYPKEKEFTRITEYKKLPVQTGNGTSYAVEYPIVYKEESKIEPYYPILTEQSKEQYEKYCQIAKKIPNLICCGRLADFKYYNMDQAIGRALNIARKILDN